MQDLDSADVTASLDRWLTVDFHGSEHLFGFADQHATTGGLSWVLSTPIVELRETRARTASGRVYSLRNKIQRGDLDDEGKTALRLLVTDFDRHYIGKAFDTTWVVTQKMARHLQVPAPSRDPDEVELFVEKYVEKWLRERAQPNT